ncbi:hypothetical protein BJ684DRAFT_18995 [Piptocephalis cylindrospora]|uniref:Uncharacterized protein n=1 Tax=Piptocephalis cylindrospora TaxID=1907219 RepID=A0A4P9Y6E9_9FUNG|nr:hypothetical protein BJ684DRAFT_18995 [Piptocephalis cylindrospora]|eukprot:RKP14617.1 hypothetical protein BJ684DRAFT_18995 [Piptocephalis cylindrospora]
MRFSLLLSISALTLLSATASAKSFLGINFGHNIQASQIQADKPYLENIKNAGKLNSGVLYEKLMAMKGKESLTEKKSKLLSVVTRIHQIQQDLYRVLTLIGSSDPNAQTLVDILSHDDARTCARDGMADKIDLINDKSIRLHDPSWCLSYAAGIRLARLEAEQIHRVREVILDEAKQLLKEIPKMHKWLVAALRTWNLKGSATVTSFFIRGSAVKVEKDPAALMQLVKKFRTRKYPAQQGAHFDWQGFQHSISAFVHQVNKERNEFDLRSAKQ